MRARPKENQTKKECIFCAVFFFISFHFASGKQFFPTQKLTLRRERIGVSACLRLYRDIFHNCVGVGARAFFYRFAFELDV